MESCPGGGGGGGVSQMGIRPGGEWSYWGLVLVGVCPEWRVALVGAWLWCVVLVESCPGEVS